MPQNTRTVNTRVNKVFQGQDNNSKIMRLLWDLKMTGV